MVSVGANLPIIEALRREYGITHVIETQMLDASSANPILKVEVIDFKGEHKWLCLKSQKQFSQNEERLRFESRVAEALTGSQVVPKTVASANGELLVTVEGKNWTVYEYIPGEAPDWLSPNWNASQVISAGTALGAIHKISHSVSPSFGTMRETYKFQGQSLVKEALLSAFSKMDAGNPSLPKELQEALESGRTAYLDAAACFEAAELTDRNLIHGDFHPGNLLFKYDQVIAVLDFEYASFGSFAFDLAYALIMFAPPEDTGDSPVNTRIANVFLEGYTKSSQYSTKLDDPALRRQMQLAALLNVAWLLDLSTNGSGDNPLVHGALLRTTRVLSRIC